MKLQHILLIAVFCMSAVTVSAEYANYGEKSQNFRNIESKNKNQMELNKEEDLVFRMIIDAIQNKNKLSLAESEENLKISEAEAKKLVKKTQKLEYLSPEDKSLLKKARTQEIDRLVAGYLREQVIKMRKFREENKLEDPLTKKRNNKKFGLEDLLTKEKIKSATRNFLLGINAINAMKKKRASKKLTLENLKSEIVKKWWKKQNELIKIAILKRNNRRLKAYNKKFVLEDLLTKKGNPMQSQFVRAVVNAMKKKRASKKLTLESLQAEYLKRFWRKEKKLIKIAQVKAKIAKFEEDLLSSSQIAEIRNRKNVLARIIRAKYLMKQKDLWEKKRAAKKNAKIEALLSVM